MTTAAQSSRVVVVGSVMVDLITYADPLPQVGQTVRGSGFQIGSGGKGANQAVTAHRLGSEVTFVACVGGDAFGEMAIASLSRQGMDASRIRRTDAGTTGVAPIWVQRDGANRIIIVPGANDALSAEIVNEELSGVEEAGCVVCQLEIPDEAVAEALRIGKALHAVTILNPAPAKREATKLFGAADWVVPNEHEFELLWGNEPTDDEILTAAARWDCGLVVTLGAAGAAATRDNTVIRRRPPKVDVLDTTGAGDAFVGGLAHALGAGMDLGTAIELGNICGALSTEAFGTQASFPTREAVEAALEQSRDPVGTEPGPQ